MGDCNITSPELSTKKKGYEDWTKINNFDIYKDIYYPPPTPLSKRQAGAVSIKYIQFFA
jgi:hypothetical protein